jgi:uncharacterized membrane protein HdeD (DUF308 family)
MTSLPIPQVSRGWSIALGIAMIILGLVAISDQIVATAMVATFIGIILLLGCSLSLIKVFTIHGWRSHFWYAIVAVAYGVAGYVFLGRPFVAAVVFTLVLGWTILISGLFRVFLAFRLRHHQGAVWILFSSIVSIILGALIISQWPGTGLYILGLFLGIELVFAGAAWLGLGLATQKGD